MDMKTIKHTSNSLSNNTSTSTSTDKMNYALQVALQTMKERCIELQRRVSSMEEENQRLREKTHDSLPSSNSYVVNTGCVKDVSLHSRLDELQRQKEQLENQICMVSNENRRLWSHLSKISKDHQQEANNEDLMMERTTRDGCKTSLGVNQSLIRSKTFTQHSPNPHLRQKIITEISLEEIPLDEFDSRELELGFPSELNVEDTISNDTNVDTKQCMDGLQDLRREAMKQQQELNSALAQLEARIASESCPDCAKKEATKPEMADKSLDTEDFSTDRTLNQVVNSIAGHAATTLPSPRLNFIQEKLKADAKDKTCPMCGKQFSSQVSFKAFQEHVEMHFIDDTLDGDSSMERQFEFVSHAVGDF